MISAETFQHCHNNVLTQVFKCKMKVFMKLSQGDFFNIVVNVFPLFIGWVIEKRSAKS